jgi:hypothetical protein
VSYDHIGGGPDRRAEDQQRQYGKKTELFHVSPPEVMGLQFLDKNRGKSPGWSTGRGKTNPPPAADPTAEGVDFRDEGGPALPLFNPQLVER